MTKKLKVWLNNKLNKSLHCTIVIKFYHIFITELVFTFVVFKYQNPFEFPKGGKRSHHLGWRQTGSTRLGMYFCNDFR